MKKRIVQVLRLVASRLGLLKDDLRNHRILGKYRTSIHASTLKSSANVWVIGCGRMGIQFIKAVNKAPNLSLIGITDRSIEAMERVSSQFNLKDIAQTQELDAITKVFNPTEDILVIATTANSHFPIMEWAMQNGIKKVLLEKPLTSSLREGQNLIELVEKNNALVYVDHTRRWMRSFQGLKLMFDKKMIGTIERVYLPYGEAGVAMIGSHFFDLVRYLFSSEIISIRSQIDSDQNENMRGSNFEDPTGVFTVVLETGLEVVVDLSNKMKRKHHIMYFLGTHGRIEVDVAQENLWIHQTSGKHWCEKFPWSVDKEGALIYALIDLAKGKRPLCDVNDGYKAIEAVIAAHQALDNPGGTANLPLTGEIIERTFSFA